LANYLNVPQCRVAGRLDYDSEGLLLLTDNGQLQQQIANPRHKLWKTYVAQVEGEIDQAALDLLENGLQLKDGATLPARARRIDPPDFRDRIPPVRARKTVPDSWLEIAIREGRNRQVRRMTAATGFPTLRLIRTHIGEWSLTGLEPGQSRELRVHVPATARQHAPRSGRPRR
jgi:23S rRNA pseudouridine2457 synthase